MKSHTASKKAAVNGNGKAPVDPNKDKAPVYYTEDTMVVTDQGIAPVDPYKDKAPVDPNKDKAPIDPNKDKAPIDPNKDKAAIKAAKDKAAELLQELANIAASVSPRMVSESPDLQNELDSLRNMTGEINKYLSGMTKTDPGNDYNFYKSKYLEMENNKLKNILVKVMLENPSLGA